MKIFPGANLLRGNFPGGNFLDRSFPGWELSRWESSWVGVVQVGIFRVGVFVGRNCPGGTYPDWEFSLVDVSLVGIIWVAIFRVGALTLPFFWFQTYYNKLSRHEQARWWEKYLSKLSILKHTCSWRDNLLYYEYWIDKQKYIHVVKYI